MNFADLDLNTQEQDLSRRKAVIDAMAARGAQPNLGDDLRKAFGQAPRGQAELEAFAKDHETYQARQQAQMQAELGQYLDRRQGTPSRPAAPDDSGTSWGPDAPAVAANPREAVVRAMTSRLPEMQAIGKADMAAINKPQEYTFHQAGDSIFKENKSTGEISMAATAPKARWVDESKVINGQDTPGQRNQMDNQWVPRTGGGTTVNLDTKGATKMQDEALKAMEGSRGQVIGAQKQLDAAQRVLQLVEDPQVLTGFGAGAVNGIAALGAKLGFNGSDSVAKTQALMTDLSQKTLDAGQQMKGSFSDSDIVFLRDVAAGKVDYNADTIKHMALLSYTAGHNTLQNALGQYHGAAGVKGLEGADKIFPLPDVSYDASISDRPGFKTRSGGYLSYSGVPGAAKGAGAQPGRLNSQGRQRMTAAEFLSMPIPGEVR